MKKIMVLFLVIILTAFTGGGLSAGFLYQSVKDNPVCITIPPDIYKIIGNSCTDCHSKGGKKMAMSHVNFSEWDSYSAAKKADKAADMVKMLKKDKMPPKLFRESHPDKEPTTDEIETLSKWAESLPKK